MLEHEPEYIDRLKLIPDRCNYDDLGAVSVDQIFHEEVADVVEREKYDLLKLAYDTLRHALSYDRNIAIPEGATFGDVFMAMFPNCKVSEHDVHDYMGMKCGVDVIIAPSEYQSYTTWLPSSLWNAPYKIESEE
jgi:hypothetical protein